jgi:hypothetical protein
MIFAPMRLWSFRKVFAALLAVVVTAGLSLSAVRADDATMKMSMQPAVTSSGHSNFRDCDRVDAGKIKAQNCAAVCAVPVVATLPQMTPVDIAERVTIAPLPKDEVVNGAKPSPEGYPPKTV